MLEQTEDLEKLAETCLAAAKTIKQYLANNGHPQMSFDQNGPALFPPATPEIQIARMGLRDAAMKLYDLASGPNNIITDDLYSKIYDIAAFRYIYRFDVAKHVPLNSTISYTDLAAKTGVDARQLRQMLNGMMSIHVFHEPQPGQVAHTASSKLLLHPLLSAYNSWLAEDTWNVAFHQIQALEKWGHACPEPNQAAFNLAMKTDKYQYEYFEEVPDLRDRFSRVMTWVSALPAFSSTFIKSGFDWSALGAGTVVDIAGNVGACSVAIAEANPQLQLVVQDLPQVIAQAESVSNDAVPPELRSRITFMSHNFYHPQPVEADVYFLRMIMHDYPDKYAAKILASIVPAMKKPNARIVLMDMVKIAPGVMPGPIERFMCAQDLQMMALTNARERSRDEFEALVKLADSRLSIKNIVTPMGSAMSLIEVGLE